MPDKRVNSWFSQLRREHTRELDELVQQAGASGGLGGVGAREMVGELNERINILMAENTVMADQVLPLLKICANEQALPLRGPYLPKFIVLVGGLLE